MLHLADLHLGSRPNLPLPLQEEVYRNRNKVIETAVDLALDPGQGIHMVIIVGDLFDNHQPEPVLIDETIRHLKRLESAGIAVVTVPGNHDEITYIDSVYRREAKRWPGILVTEPMPTLITKINVNGDVCNLVSMAYTGGVSKTDKPLANFPLAEKQGVNLALFHGSLDWNTGERSVPLDGTALAAAGYDYIALGHIHRGGKRKPGNSLANYCGMVAGKSFNDPGVGYWTIVTLGDGPARITTLSANIRPWRVVDMDVSVFNEYEELEEAIKQLIEPEDIIKIRLIGTIAFDPNIERLESSLNNLCRYIEVENNTEGWKPDMVSKYAAEPTIRGFFVRRLQKQLTEVNDPEKEKVIRKALWRGLLALKGGNN
ncbi:MAG: repair protein SbcD/Mre11 [Clostridia bacterium]|nr:repair protein SbcD/Mre11 [Clostridia bacterium]